MVSFVFHCLLDGVKEQNIFSLVVTRLNTTELAIDFLLFGSSHKIIAGESKLIGCVCACVENQ